LEWVSPRKQAFLLLRLDDFADKGNRDADNSGDGSLLSAAQTELLRSLSASGSVEAALFWCTCDFARLLADWGHWFSRTAHGCPCHPKGFQKKRRDPSCPMTGRTAVLFASGFAEAAIGKLRAISAGQMPAHAREALKELTALDPAAANSLMEDFQSAISRLVFRTQQNFGYWTKLPWSLLMIMRPFLETFSSEEDAAGLQLLTLNCLVGV